MDDETACAISRDARERASVARQRHIRKIDAAAGEASGHLIEVLVDDARERHAARFAERDSGGAIRGSTDGGDTSDLPLFGPDYECAGETAVRVDQVDLTLIAVQDPLAGEIAHRDGRFR